MVRAKKIIYAKPFKGEPTPWNFQEVEEDLGNLNDCEVLVEAHYLSVDPYMRTFMEAYPIGSTMIGGQVAKIIDSKNPKFPKGSFCYAHSGWRTHSIIKPKDGYDFENYLLPDYGKLPLSLALGVCGIPGATAYFGFLEICQPKHGETVVVSTAAGAVGSIVGQIAKIKGCRVVGITGSDEKCKWLIEELGFDAAINYKTADLKKELKEAAPNGIDSYFDNVGGEISNAVYQQMNLFGRVAVCGAITGYNDQEVKVEAPQKYFLAKQLTIRGFTVYNYTEKWMEAFQQLLEWVKDGKIKFQETVTKGFDNMPRAFIDLLNGKNIGKAVVKA